MAQKRKVIMYGSANCPGCKKAKEILAAEGITYGYIDVLEDLARLKKFLNMRDAHHNTEFAKTVENGKVGIPCFMVDDEILYVGLPEDLDLLR